MAKRISNKLNHYDGFEVIERFEIRKNLICEMLQDWMNANGELTEVEMTMLNSARTHLTTYGRAWNEEELKINFIGIIFFVADINVNDKILTFFERKLTGKVNNIDISVTIDGMIAKPTLSGRPSIPYFFLQEYKKTLGDDHDPEGQMLAAMILSQALNNDLKYVYGCWIQGRIWQFTTLLDKNYCVSKAFDATDIDDLRQIVLILRKLKDLIINR
jgi:hypothetical protein